MHYPQDKRKSTSAGRSHFSSTRWQQHQHQISKSWNMQPIDRFLTIYAQCSHLTKTMLFIFLGVLLFFVPGILLFHFGDGVELFAPGHGEYPNGKAHNGKEMSQPSNFLTQFTSSFLFLGVPVFMWYFYIFFCWVLYFTVRLVLRILPKLIVFVIETILGSENDFIRHYIDYIDRAKAYAIGTISFGIFYSLFVYLVFPPDYWMERTGKEWPLIFSRFLFAGLIVTGTLLVEKLLLQVIAVKFHSKTYKAKIQRSKNEAYFFGSLAGYVNKKKKVEVENDDTTPGSSRPTSNIHLIFKNGKNAINQSKQLLSKVVMTLTKVADNVTSLMTHPAELVDALDECLDSRKDTLQFASYLFDSLLSNPETSTTLKMKDFQPAFSTAEEAREAFDHFDVDMSGDITRQEFLSCFMKSFDDRRAIQKSLKDYGNVIGSLDSLMQVISFVVMVIGVLAVFGVESTNILASFGSMLLASSFLFSATAKTVFEAIIFLMVVHPFDAGDKVVVGGDTLLVKEIDLMSTVFVRDNGCEMVMPNEVLCKQAIHNINRSGYQTDHIPIHLPYSAAASKESLESIMEIIKDNMQDFIQDHPRDFVPNSLILASQGFSIKENVIHLTLSVCHKSNFQQKETTVERRNKILVALKDTLDTSGLSKILFEVPYGCHSCY